MWLEVPILLSRKFIRIAMAKRVGKGGIDDSLPPTEGHCMRAHGSGRNGNKAVYYWTCRLCGDRLITYDRKTDSVTYPRAPPCMALENEVLVPTHPPKGSRKKDTGPVTPPYPWREPRLTGQQKSMPSGNSVPPPPPSRRGRQRRSEEAGLPMEEDCEPLAGEWQKVVEDPTLRKEVQDQNQRLVQMENSVKNIELLLTSQTQAQTAATTKSGPSGQAGVVKAD